MWSPFVRPPVARHDGTIKRVTKTVLHGANGLAMQSRSGGANEKRDGPEDRLARCLALSGLFARLCEARGNLGRKVGDGHLDLLVGVHVTQGRDAGLDLVGAEHDAEARAELVSLLELALEGAALVVGLGADVGLAKRERGREDGVALLGAGAGDVDAGGLVTLERGALGREGKRDALEAHGEADTRRGLAALDSISKTVRV